MFETRSAARLASVPHSRMVGGVGAAVVVLQ